MSRNKVQLPDRFTLYTKMLSTHRTSSYGFCHVEKPSLFWTDEEMNTFDEMANWRNDLKKEKQGESDFTRGWGMGTNFESSMDIDVLLDAFRNVEG